jgi:hypothetical protein
LKINIIEKMRIIYIVVATSIVIILSSCSKKITEYGMNEKVKSLDGIPKYEELQYWAAHPNKKDPSDSIPIPLKNDVKDKEVDVFFLHPTTLLGKNTENITNANIADNKVNYKTDYSPILYQASVFNERARIYAPRYRQAHISMYFEKDSIKKINSFELAYDDIKKAFTYYMENENKGRPIIIASHSQGTTHAIRLVKEFFDNKVLSKQLVCAYLLGMGVKKNEYETIPICYDSTSTGCFVSWRTYREDYESQTINRTDSTIAVTNPLSWKNTDELINKNNHKGAVLLNYNKIYKKTHNAQAKGNALWVSHPKFPGSIFYRTKNYHSGDINLFYVDIREDISRRIEIFKNKQKL